MICVHLGHGAVEVALGASEEMVSGEDDMVVVTASDKVATSDD
jgi:hypothetical protein